MINLPPPPPTLDSYRNGTKLRVGLGETTIIADLDFETYSPAGYHRGTDGRLHPPRGCSDSGLFAVGAACYSEHPGAEVICMAYDLKDGKGRTLWRPTIEWLPVDLFEYLATGGLVEAWNVSFEYWIWTNVCVPKYGFPPLPIAQLRCAAAKARAHALPGGLEKAGEVLNIKNKKDKDGKRLIGKFSIPRNFTKDDRRERILTEDDSEDAQRFYDYCLRDIQAEAELSSLIPDLTPEELEFWQCDQAINRRGIQIDLEHANAAINIVEQAYAKYNAELRELTNGAVNAASEVARLIRWLDDRGVSVAKLDAKTVEDLLANCAPPKASNTSDLRVVEPIPALAHRALQIREALSSAAVKKLYSMVNRANRTGRVNDLFIYHSARTGRAAGEALQPQNLPKSGPNSYHCTACSHHYHADDSEGCPWCGADVPRFAKEWNYGAVLDALQTIRPGDLNCMEYHWDDPLGVIAGCLRSLIVAAEGQDLICSDYSAIEAVVLAALAGEEWRMEVFRTHGKIYEMSAAKISGIPFEEFDEHRLRTGGTRRPDGSIEGGVHHPARGKIGKVAELACLGQKTQVLTKRGYADIIDIKPNDELWDGVEWVTHGGVISKGRKLVLNLDGVEITRNHPVNLGGQDWSPAGVIYQTDSKFQRALLVGGCHLPTVKRVAPCFDFEDVIPVFSTKVSEATVEVYDVVNAGPRNRFTIKTKTGHLIVHNSGYGGYLGAWKQFGADKFMSDDEIKQAALAWRRASPKIVQMWGGQGRYGSPPSGLEGAAISAVANPGKWFEYRGIGYITQQDILYCRLLSGRLITYHRPLLQPGERSPISLSFEGWNTNPKNGPIHKWIRMRTYGGKLTENVVQATARDILAHAVVALERAGYPVVLHVHDEIVAEVPKGFGSVEEFERIMSTLPAWARDWPVRARGGWRGDRYRKEG